MKKKTKIIIVTLIFITITVAWITIKNMDKEFTGGISSHWLNEDIKNPYWASIDLEGGYSKENLDYLGSIATKNRNNELSELESKDLGTPTHHMMVYESSKSTKITEEIMQFNLWIYKDKGYIQSIKEEDMNNTKPEQLNGISQLDNTEYQFITKSLLTYYSSDILF